MPKVSIIIRSFNDITFIEQTMQAILDQEYQDFELINVDNGSTDGTWEVICRMNPDGIKYQVTDYVPGRILNEAVSQASGSIVVFNNSDCVPLNSEWLGNMTYPLRNNPELKIGAVFGNQLPRANAHPLVKKDNLRAFGDGVIASSWRHFFSLGTSAAPRKLLIVNRFDHDIKYSEDIEWSWRMKKSGYDIIYVPQAMVEHSHNYTIAQVKKRFYGEGFADGEIYGGKCSMLCGCLLPLMMEVLRDLEWLIKNFKIFSIPFGLIYRITQRFSYWRGRHDYTVEHPENLKPGVSYDG
jgi:glycosyltransferase involved in cell wall biosynthesis